jgi:tRNA (Thr-GGU) A37 N-methylase
LGLERWYGVLPLSRFSFYRSQRGVYNVGFPSGLSVVELIAAGQNVLDVKGLDDLDGVPLLDVQPYFPSIDESPVARRGRLEHKLGKERS